MVMRNELLQDLLDSEHINQSREDDDERFIGKCASFVKKLGEAGTDDIESDN